MGFDRSPPAPLAPRVSPRPGVKKSPHLHLHVPIGWLKTNTFRLQARKNKHLRTFVPGEQTLQSEHGC